MNEGLKSELEAQKNPKNSRHGNPMGFYWSSFEMFHCFGIYDLEYFDYEENYNNVNILDFGCGSKLRTGIWKGNNVKLYGIDPLLDEFKTHVPWNDLDKLEKGYSVGGETFVDEIKRQMDVVIAVNSIDHGSKWKDMINNIYEYLKPGGELYLFVDINKVHSANDKMHHTIDGFELVDTISEKFEIKEKYTSPGFTRSSTKISLLAVKK